MSEQRSSLAPASRPREAADRPALSIMIACRNEEIFIGKCLDSIVTSRFPLHRLEVLVIDGMSHDGTRAVLDRYSTRYPFIKVLDNIKRVTPAAFNIGIRHARGDLIMIMSAHATFAPDAIAKAVASSVSSGADNVGGRWRIVPRRDSFLARAVVAALSHRFGVGNAVYRTAGSGQPRWVDTAAYGCYRREVFERLGGFNEHLVRGQDMEFNLRLKRAGGRTLFVPDIVVNYYARSSLRSFAVHAFTNGVWAILPFVHTAGMPVSWRHLAPLSFVGALSAAVGVSAAFGWAPMVVVAGPYVLAAAAAGGRIAIDQRDARFAIAMPLLFATLHLSYGIGSVWGLCRAAAHFAGRARAAAAHGACEPVNPEPLRAKRLFDVSVAVVGLALLSPLLMVIAALIKWQDGGPVFYRGLRVGRFGRLFRIFKFRTMVMNAEQVGGSSTADGDSRVTPIGRVIRRYKLDELSQLFNVLTGDMSLVGPRPEVERYVVLMSEEEQAILSIRPGITDWATLWNSDEGAVLAGSTDPDKTYLDVIRPEKIRLQLEYVRRRSFAVDLAILVRTVVAVVSHSRPAALHLRSLGR